MFYVLHGRKIPVGTLTTLSKRMVQPLRHSYIFNPADRPGPTIRETTERSKFHMNSGTSTFNKGGYTVANPRPVLNNRMNQSDYFYAGNASAGDGTMEARAYDAEYRQRNNDVKSSTIDGRLVPGHMSTYES